MTFEEYAQKHLGDAGLSYSAIELVRMGWNARGSYGNCQGILDDCEITPEMIEAGAQRLVSWEDSSVWPDSWSPAAVAAARNDAERVLRSALNARANHIVDANKMPQGDVSNMGMMTLAETEETYRRAILVTFETDEDINAAISQGQCRFTVFGGEV